jgi:uncharacterized membrane protein AbrB (regulator of aidB expression)
MKKSTWLLLIAGAVVAYLLWKWSKTPQRTSLGGGGFVDGNPL